VSPHEEVFYPLARKTGLMVRTYVPLLKGKPMLTALIPLVTKIVVSTSAGIAIDSAVKMIVPVGMKTLPAFGIKIGTAIGSALIAGKIGSVVENNLVSVIETVQNTGAEEVTSDQEDN